MKSHRELNDEQFEKMFASLRMPEHMFTHEAHLRLAWIHIRKYGVDVAVENIRQQLRRFVDHHGDASKYHVTLTTAAVLIVNHFIHQSRASEFQVLLRLFPELSTRFHSLLQSHYSIELMDSEKARKQFLSPDLAPFN